MHRKRESWRLKKAKMAKKHLPNPKRNGLSLQNPRERTTHTMLATKLLTTGNIMFAR